MRELECPSGAGMPRWASRESGYKNGEQAVVLESVIVDSGRLRGLGNALTLHRLRRGIDLPLDADIGAGDPPRLLGAVADLARKVVRQQVMRVTVVGLRNPAAQRQVQADGQQQPILVLSLQGSSVSQISTEIGRTERTVQRVLQRLRKHLERMAHEESVAR